MRTGTKTTTPPTAAGLRSREAVASRASVESSWLFNLGADLYSWFTDQAVWRASCARLASRLSDLESPWIADLGCGPGVSTFQLARRLPGARLVGLDIAPRMLRQARRRRRTSGLSS